MKVNDKIEKVYQKYLTETEENKKYSYKSYFVNLFRNSETDKLNIDSETQVN